MPYFEVKGIGNEAVFTSRMMKFQGFFHHILLCDSDFRFQYNIRKPAAAVFLLFHDPFRIISIFLYQYTMNGTQVQVP